MKFEEKNFSTKITMNVGEDKTIKKLVVSKPYFKALISEINASIRNKQDRVVIFAIPHLTTAIHDLANTCNFVVTRTQ